MANDNREGYMHGTLWYPVYVPPSDDVLYPRLEKAKKALSCAFTELGLDINDPNVYIDFDVIHNALIRTDQRMLHYRMYHDGMVMSELKRIAVFSYWVLRMKPINRLEDGSPRNINEKVVLSWIVKAIGKYRRKRGLPDVFCAGLLNDLTYNFAYRDISCDYMTMLIEVLKAGSPCGQECEKFNNCKHRSQS